MPEFESQELSNVISFEDGITIEPVKTTVNLDNTARFKKLALNEQQIGQVSELARYLPAAAATAMSAAQDVYVMTVPKGLPYTLSEFKKHEGYMNILRDTITAPTLYGAWQSPPAMPVSLRLLD